MTGIGGDMFCLFYDAKTKKISALNGSGRSPTSASLEDVRTELGIPDDKVGSIPMLSPLAVTVPGAAAGWVDTVDKFGSGKVSLEQILTPAIELGEEGYPVHELVARLVRIGSHLQIREFVFDVACVVEIIGELDSECISQLPRNPQA